MSKEKMLYLGAIAGLVLIVWWLKKSTDAQATLINSIASPFNVKNPKITDMKFGVKEKEQVPKLTAFLGGNKRMEKKDATLNNEAKFPGRSDELPSSSHERYIMEKGQDEADRQMSRLNSVEFALSDGSITAIKTSGEINSLPR